jgi:DNA-binding protein
MNQMPKELKELILKSHGGLIKQSIDLENQLKAKALKNLRTLSNKANNK